jgi:hypothetical protein
VREAVLKNTKFVVLMIVMVIAITDCAPNVSYRSDLNVCNYNKAGDCEQAAIQYSGNGTDEEYHLGFVEFDDQGQLWDRHQLETVLDKFSLIAEKNDVLLITFVHGWHHNASSADSNVKEFRNLLARLAKAEAGNSRIDGHRARTVLGVYIGWRGDSITIPWLNGLTYWDRKNTAHNVGGGGVAEVFLKLEEIVNAKTGITDGAADRHHSRLVVMGHSFGGALVSAALHQILTDRFIDGRAGKPRRGDANGFGDLVVMLNPAFEAMRFASLYDISQQGCRRYSRRQLPKLVILTSEADWATKYAFTAGRYLSTLFETHSVLKRHYCNEDGEQVMWLDEGDADREAVGHFETFRTHRLLPASQSAVRSTDFDFQSLQQNWAKQKPAEKLMFESAELQHLDRTRSLNPYLNIYVDEALIAGHNEIWGDEVVSFIRDMIMISTMTPKASD